MIKKIVICATLLLISSYSQTSEKIVNGYKEFWDLKYNEVSYLLAHNSNALAPSIVNNQNLTIPEILKLTRAINIDIHFHENYGGTNGIDEGDELWVGHGMYRSVFYKDYYSSVLEKIQHFCAKVDKRLNQIEAAWVTKPIINPIQEKFEQLKGFLFAYTDGLKPIAAMERTARKTTYGSSHRKAILPYTSTIIDPSARPLREVLAEIRQHLEQNPNDVLTLSLEIATRNLDAVAQEFIDAGLTHYAHIQDATKPWPTLGQMIESGKRLVIFSPKRDKEKKYPWLLYGRTFVWSSRGSFSKKKELLADTHLPTDNKTFKRRHKEPQNTIFGLSNHLTILFGGSEKAAKKANKWNILEQRVENLAIPAQSRPVFITADFVELGDAVEFVEALNGVGKYQGKPLFDFGN